MSLNKGSKKLLFICSIFIIIGLVLICFDFAISGLFLFLISSCIFIIKLIRTMTKKEHGNLLKKILNGIGIGFGSTIGLFILLVVAINISLMGTPNESPITETPENTVSMVSNQESSTHTNDTYQTDITAVKSRKASQIESMSGSRSEQKSSLINDTSSDTVSSLKNSTDMNSKRTTTEVETDISDKQSASNSSSEKDVAKSDSSKESFSTSLFKSSNVSESISSTLSSKQETSTFESSTTNENITYILVMNTSTMKYHTKCCPSEAKIDTENRFEYQVSIPEGTEQDKQYIESLGYTLCKHCEKNHYQPITK